MIRLRNAKVCICGGGGISWSNSGTEGLPSFPHAQFLGSWSLNFASALLQSAKKIYESLLGDGVNATTLAHIQVRNFELFGRPFSSDYVVWLTVVLRDGHDCLMCLNEGG
jgi:hypothetical protein